MATAKAIVYGLKRSDGGGIRYIGQTMKNPKERLAQHLKRARNKGRDYAVVRWMRRALKEGAKIELVVLKKDAVLDQTEKKVISNFRASGVNLLNLSDGGAGLSGHTWKLSDQDRARRSVALMGNKNCLGKKFSVESRNRMSVAKKKQYAKNGHHSTGTTLTKEHKKKISAALIGRFVSDTTKQKMRKPKSEEHKRKLAEAARLRWAKTRGEA